MKLRSTYALILIFVGVFFAVNTFFSPEEIVQSFGFSGENLVEGRIWTLVTSIFLHGSVAHLALNSIALFFFGRALESEVSLKQVLTIFFLGGIVGNLFVLFTYPTDQVVIGASGAVFAIMGTAIILAPFDFIPYPVPLPLPLALIGVFVAISEVLTFLSGGHGNVAHIAHMGGLAAGLAFGFREGGSKTGILALVLILLIILILPYLWPVLTEFTYIPILYDFLG
ncbi:MAG: rhomboid family intramembrane serine protease [Candidatus Aenigmatarchaeota archaeon]